MNRIQKRFADLKAAGQSALVGFITAGDPDMERSVEIVEAMCQGGLDVLELGVPFSDPTADGPVIQRSSQRAIAKGATLAGCFEIVKRVRKNYDLPVILFSYYNPIFSYGPQRFCCDAKLAGADGCLLVDLPPEEAGELADKFSADFPVIRLIAPTTSQERARFIAGGAGGFLYVISRTGVTGTGGVDEVAVKEHVASIRAVTNLPLCVGFGISTPQQAAAVAGFADGVVVGSAFEKVIEENLNSPDLPQMLYERVRLMKQEMQAARV